MVQGLESCEMKSLAYGMNITMSTRRVEPTFASLIEPNWIKFIYKNMYLNELHNIQFQLRDQKWSLQFQAEGACGFSCLFGNPFCGGYIGSHFPHIVRSNYGCNTSSMEVLCSPGLKVKMILTDFRSWRMKVNLWTKQKERDDLVEREVRNRI